MILEYFGINEYTERQVFFHPFFLLFGQNFIYFSLKIIYIYIITIQTISVGPTKYTQHSPGVNIFPFESSDQILHDNCGVVHALWMLCKQNW